MSCTTLPATAITRRTARLNGSCVQENSSPDPCLVNFRYVEVTVPIGAWLETPVQTVYLSEGNTYLFHADLSNLKEKTTYIFEAIGQFPPAPLVYYTILVTENGSIFATALSRVDHHGSISVLSGDSHVISIDNTYPMAHLVVVLDGETLVSDAPYAWGTYTVGVGTAVVSFVNVTADHVLAVTYSFEHVITVTELGASSRVTPIGAAIVTEGDNFQVDIDNTDMDTLTVVLDGDTLVSGDPYAWGTYVEGVGAVVSFIDVIASHALSVDYTFAVVTYTITSSAGTGGEIDPLGDVIVDDGADQEFAIQHTTRMIIGSVKIDGAAINLLTDPNWACSDFDEYGNCLSGVYTFSSVDSDHTIAATFSNIG